VVEYLYIAWFRDPKLPPDDQDYEWVACFRVAATNPIAAQAWGDMLAKSHGERSGEPFLSSSVEEVDESHKVLPLVRVGDTDNGQIGW
jgi:hypothetical protein